MGPLAAFSRDTRGVHCGSRQSREQPLGVHRALWHGAVRAPLPSTSANKALSAALGRSWGTGCSPGLPSSLPAPLADIPRRAAVLNTRFPISAPGFQQPPVLFKARGGEEAAPVRAMPFSTWRDPARANLHTPAAHPCPQPCVSCRATPRMVQDSEAWENKMENK